MGHLNFINLLAQHGDIERSHQRVKEIPFFDATCGKILLRPSGSHCLFSGLKQAAAHQKENHAHATQTEVDNIVHDIENTENTEDAQHKENVAKIENINNLASQTRVGDEVYIFCDGSKIGIENQDPISALAFVVCDSSGLILYEHGAYTKKNYNYEIQSILKALHWCEEKKVKRIFIYSDSASDIWHLKNYHSQRYQHKVGIYESVMENPEQCTRPKRWRGSERVNILVEKSRIVEKALRLSESFEHVSFGYIPREYNTHANDLAKNLTKNHLMRVGVFFEGLDNVLVMKEFDLSTIEFDNLTSLQYKSHQNVHLYHNQNCINLAQKLKETNVMLKKGQYDTPFSTLHLIEDYQCILESLQEKNIRHIQIFDGKLSALLNGYINISGIVTKENKKYQKFLNTLNFFDKIYVCNNFSTYEKNKNKCATLSGSAVHV